MKLLVLLVYKALIISFWVSILILLAGTYLPHNPLTPSGKIKYYLLTIMPQGWGFFTKNPQDPDIFIYAREGNSWKNCLFTPNGALRNSLGVKRIARSQGVEYGKLLTQLASGGVKWYECSGKKHFDCMESQPLEPVNLTNVSKTKTICGEVWIVSQRPVPWAWSRNEVAVNMQFKLLKLNVNCAE